MLKKTCLNPLTQLNCVPLMGTGQQSSTFKMLLSYFVFFYLLVSVCLSYFLGEGVVGDPRGVCCFDLYNWRGLPLIFVNHGHVNPY